MWINEGRFASIVTPNALAVYECRKNKELFKVFREADLAIADGMGLFWGMNFLGHPVQERIPGVDFMEQLCRLAAGEGWPVFFLGGKPGIAEKASHCLVEKYPKLLVAGVEDGFFDEAASLEICERISASKAKLLFVALGSPRQELWISEHRDALGSLVAMGVGGSFDIFAGCLRRAPEKVATRRLRMALSSSSGTLAVETGSETPSLCSRRPFDEVRLAWKGAKRRMNTHAAAFMVRDLTAISEDDAVLEAVRVMYSQRISGILWYGTIGIWWDIFRDGYSSGCGSHLSGVLAQSTFLRIRREVFSIASRFLLTKGERFHVRELIAVEPTTSLMTVADLMLRKRIKRLPVSENGKLVGIIDRGAFCEFMMEAETFDERTGNKR
jgi:exopolysaccharide biosynthesis WecB/TagA/CpsF family protein